MARHSTCHLSPPQGGSSMASLASALAAFEEEMEEIGASAENEDDAKPMMPMMPEPPPPNTSSDIFAPEEEDEDIGQDEDAGQDQEDENAAQQSARVRKRKSGKMMNAMMGAFLVASSTPIETTCFLGSLVFSPCEHFASFYAGWRFFRRRGVLFCALSMTSDM